MTELTVLTGTVLDITNRTVNTKYGAKPVYDVVLDNGQKFSTGFKAPASFGITKGAPLTATCTKGKYGYDFQSLGAAAGAGAPDTSAPVSRGSGASGRPFPVPNTSGETAIIRQNALTNAVNWYNANVVEDREAPSTDDVVAERIISMAYRFAEFSSGQREVRVLDSMGSAE